MNNATSPGTRIPLPPGLCLSAALIAFLAATACASAQAAEGDAVPAPLPGLDEVLNGYNARLQLTMTSIDSLWARQEMQEPTGKGEDKTAEAVLTYNRENGLHREELSSNLGHMTGEYTLRSLVGPELLHSEYSIGLDGVEVMEGYESYRLVVEAIKRDRDHFDGTVWVAVDDFGLVRAQGSVSDTPFPITRVTFDKAFEPGPHGLWLVRRHTGEAAGQVGFIKRKGTMHIFYFDYHVEVGPAPHDGDTCDER